MKNISFDSISRQLLLIGMLAIIPIGCATETEEQPDEQSSRSAQIEELEANNEPVAEENPAEEANNEAVAEETPAQETAGEERSTETIQLERAIYFDFDSARLTEESKERLQEVATELTNNTNNNNIEIRIEGHADERGSHEYNMELGHQRAEAVKEYLASVGVDRAYLSTVSYGEKQPLLEESHPEAWSQNRRVEFIVIEPAQATLAR